MIRTLLLLALLATPILANGPQEPLDVIKKKITKAEAVYTTELAKAQTETIKWLDGRDAAARKKGDKTTVNLVKTQREKLDTEGTIPKPSPINISRKIDTARDMLDATYAALLKEALMLKLDDLADELEEKRTQLSKEKPDFRLVSYMAKNMVENGSFETPEILNGLDTAPLKNNGWLTSTNDVVRFKGAVPVHGNQMLHLNSNLIQQVHGFTIGDQYIVTVNVGTYATPQHPNSSSTVIVGIAGEKETKTVTATNRGSKTGYAMSGVGAKWEQITIVFKALEETHELTISAGALNDYIAVIDQVSILPHLGN